MSWHDHETQGPNRILELELEVKRLREAHQQVLDSEAKDGDYLRLCILHQNISQDALSAPPPALAEAYVRLRNAASDYMSGGSQGAADNLEAALAEIEKLEKGE